jgi:hypothetical protein
VTDFGTLSVPVVGLQSVAAPPMWTFSVADLRSGVILADLPFNDVSFSTPLNDCGTFSASLMIDDKIAKRYDIHDLTTPARRAWYAIRDSRPMFGGIIWTSTYSSDEQKVSVAGADWWSYFDARKVLPVLADLDQAQTGEVAKLTTRYTTVEQNELARELVALAQSHTGGDILVRSDTSSSGIYRERSYMGYDLKVTGEALKQFSEVLDGPDMRFTVAADPTAPGGIARLFVQGEPWLGQVGSEHVLEYGRNLLGYTWPRDGSAMATRTFALGDGMEQGMPIAWSEDSDLYGAGWPLLEREFSYTTVREEDTLIEHAQSDQITARAPIVLPTLSLKAGLSPHLGEYASGDDARLIIRDRYWGGADGFAGSGLDTLVRLNDVQVSYSTGDGESVTLVCAPLAEGII